jgi:hypothetical protein
LKDLNFLPIAVAFDSAGASAAGQWIAAANPSYPSLIDRRHIVAELYDMVNVPTAVWIDEQGRIVRPAEIAGYSDAFRKIDRATFAFPPDAEKEKTERRAAYLDALRDWARNGAASRYALAPEEVLRRMHTPDDAHALAAANFRMGEYLHETGRSRAAQKYFDEARRLRPESWNYKRQAWALEDPAKASGPEFWAAVDALGGRSYYPQSGDI